MLQRIQTVYLLLALICLGLMYAFNIAEIAVPEHMIYFNPLGMTAEGGKLPGSTLLLGFQVLLPVVILNVIYTIVLFRQRKKQLKWAMLSMLLTLILVTYIVFVVGAIEEKNQGADVLYTISFYLPIAAACFLLLSMRGIRKDEKLVKSLDRLR